MTIADNLKTIRDSIPSPVTLMAVSKTVEEARLREALAAGQRVFGENYVQEAKARWPKLKTEYPDVQLRLIGHLQSNKAQDAVDLFDRIDTLDRPGLAHALAKAMRKKDRFISCLIEVNIGDEPQKGGCVEADVERLLNLARQLCIPVDGLMCIPPHAQDPTPWFRKLAEMARQHSLKTISMGMSGDYQTAIACGTTEVRIGTAIFGERKK